MEALKYTVIKTRVQYDDYCNKIEELTSLACPDGKVRDETELLSLLVQNWDERHNIFKEPDPIKLLHSLMTDHNMKAKDIASILGISKGLVSDILNYNKGLSKEVIRLLASHFSISQEAFNRPYELKNNSKNQESKAAA